MRPVTLALITLAAAAVAGAASAQQAAAPAPVAASGALPGAEFNGTPPTIDYSHLNEVGAAAAEPKDVYAVVSHHIVSGTIQPGSKLLDLVDASQSQFSCRLFHKQAQIAMACTDGSLAQVSMTALGCGHSRGGAPASLCIGVPVKVAAHRLTGAPGETVSVEDGRLTLKPSA